ncbi:polysaccharide deacetylase family protein [soil metagenome]
MIFTCSTDDGHPSDMKMADLLDRHGLTGTFYIPIRNREGYPVMPEAHMREIGRRFEVASHTLDHCFLNSVDIDGASMQIVRGKQLLEDIMGEKVYGFCYPGGKYGLEHLRLVHQAGFRYARTTMNLCFDSGANRYEMPTTCQFYPHTRSVYVRNFLSAGNWKKRQAGLQVALGRKDWIGRIHRLFDHALEHGRIFHLWAHSRDIDALDAWNDLDVFFARVAGQVAKENRLTNHQLAGQFYPL